MRAVLIAITACVAITLGGLAAVAVADGVSTTTVFTPFKGLTVRQIRDTSPRPVRITVVEIDLRTPGIRFRVTPPNGKLPGETTLQTTRDFLTEQHAQLAINASFYSIVEKDYGNSEGYAASEGEVYSGPSTRPSGSPSLNLSRDNVASIVDHPKKRPAGASKGGERSAYFNTVSGNERIIRDGKNVAKDIRLHPRMAAGVCDNGRRLVIVEVDGRQKGISEGMTTPEIVDVLLEYRVTDAVNLDGGGSATVAIADPKPRVLNVPVGIKDVPGTERRNAANLAIFAPPMTEASRVSSSAAK